MSQAESIPILPRLKYVLVYSNLLLVVRDIGYHVEVALKTWDWNNVESETELDNLLDWNGQISRGMTLLEERPSLSHQFISGDIRSFEHQRLTPPNLLYKLVKLLGRYLSRTHRAEQDRKLIYQFLIGH